MLKSHLFATLLRRWRQARRLTQMELAAAANISQRHLSCLETGKAQPRRDAVLRLSNALEVPLPDSNSLLIAAGYAPVHVEPRFGSQPFAEIRRAIDLLLDQQEPYPGAVLDKYWNIVRTNKGFDRVVRHVLGGRESRHSNMIRQIFDPDDVRRSIGNWEEIARAVLQNLQHLAAFSPKDETAQQLLAEVLSYPGVPTSWGHHDLSNPPAPVLATIMRAGDNELSFFSTITTFAMHRDAGAEDVRIECCFPTDDLTHRICATLDAADEVGKPGHAFADPRFSYSSSR